jgi:hypothetical protein
MESIYPYLLGLHGVAGSVALLTFWMAGLARKGSRLHVRSGQVYLLAMLGVVISAAPMAYAFVLLGHLVTASFLAYLVVITASSMWLGWRAVGLKRNKAAYYGRGYPAVAVFNLVAALAVLALGLSKGNPLLIGFSAVGGLIGGGMLYRLRRPIEAANWWLQEHYGAMLGCGAATHVAFLALGSDRVARSLGLMLPPSFSLLAWILPVVVSTAVGLWLDRRHARPRPMAAGAGAGAAAGLG